MKYLSNDYIINFKGLDVGSHYFEYKIDGTFFEAKGIQDFRKANVTAKVEMIKESTMLVFNFVFHGNVELECDRCLDRYEQQMKGTARLIVKFGDKAKEISEEILIVPFEAYQIDISQYLYEFIVLSLPVKHVHPDDKNGFPTCNPEMLERLENLTIKNDTRWDALKNIKLE